MRRVLLCRCITVSKIPLPGYNISGHRIAPVGKLYGGWYTTRCKIGGKACLWRRIYSNIICLGNAIGPISIAYYQGHRILSRRTKRHDRVLQVGKVTPAKIPVPKGGIACREIFKVNSKWRAARYNVGVEIGYRRLSPRPLYSRK